MIGFYDYITARLHEHSLKNGYLVSIDELANVALEFRKAELDTHIIIGGQNGVGKSYLMLALARLLLNKMGCKDSLYQANSEGKIYFIFPTHSKEDFEHMIRSNDESIFLIDELKPFFDYKTSMTKKQISLYNTIEIARAKKHIYIGCARDYTKLDNNYRNAKAQFLIYLFDRVVNYNTKSKTYETKFSYGAVFTSNISVEYEDKFMFSQLRGYDLATTKALAEKLPTWVGNIFVKPPATYGLTPEDLRFYHDNKMLAMGATYDDVFPELADANKKFRRKKISKQNTKI